MANIGDTTAPFRQFVPGDVIEYDVEGDLSSYEYCMVELDTARNRCVKAYAGGIGVGILTNKPVETATSTNFSLVALVQNQGRVLWKAGESGLAVGDLVTPGTGGVGDVATPADGDVVYGQCEVAAAAGLPATVRFFAAPVFVSIPGE